MSKWSCSVVRIPEVKKHPGADKLEIIEVEGTVCLSQSGVWKAGDLAVLIPIDSVVPTTDPNFEFLKKANNSADFARIKAVRLRGIFSDGLLCPVPKRKWYQKGLKIGDDASRILGITKFEEDPVETTTKVNLIRRFFKKWLYFTLRFLGFKVKDRSTKGPKPVFYLSTGQACPVYDLDKYAKYRSALENQEIVVTEKIHGMNTRIISDNGEVVIGSHKVVNTNDETFKKALEKFGVLKKMENLPGWILFGETIGTQDLKYGFDKENPGFVAFDLYNIAEKRFAGWFEFETKCQGWNIPMAPVLYKGPYDEKIIADLANSANPKKPHMSVLDPQTLREGIVVKTKDEAIDARNRVALKFVSEAYLLRSGGTERH